MLLSHTFFELFLCQLFRELCQSLGYLYVLGTYCLTASAADAIGRLFAVGKFLYSHRCKPSSACKGVLVVQIQKSGDVKLLWAVIYAISA